MPFRVDSVRKLDNSTFRPYLEKPEVQNNLVTDDSFYMGKRTCMGTVQGRLQLAEVEEKGAPERHEVYTSHFVEGAASRLSYIKQHRTYLS